MNTEELSKVAEIIGSLGQNASDGLLAYLGFSFATNLLGYLVGLFALWCGYKILSALMGHLQLLSHSILAFKEMRTLLKIGSPGSLMTREINDICAKIKEMANKTDS